MLDGARLYRDIVEINPPLVFWLNLPIAALSRATGLPDVFLFRICVVLAAAASLWLCARLLPLAWRSADGRPAALGPLAVLVGLSTVLLAMPVGYFGQREHLTLALVAPWLLAAAAETEGGEPERGLLFVAGGAAALGIALKPHFLVVWLACALYGRVRQGRAYRWLGPLNATIAAGLAAYGLLVAIAAPDYLRIVATLGSAYQRFSARPALAILTRDTLPLSAIAALVAYAGFRRAVGPRVLADHLALATAGFLAAVLLQGKGFGYHYLPAIGTAVLLLLTILFGRADRAPRVVRAAALVCVPLLLAGTVWPFLGTAVRRARGILSPVDAAMVATARLVRDEAAGRPIAVLSPRLADAFPLVPYSGATWALRLPNLWCIASAAAEGPAERWCVRSVGEDLARSRPALVLVRRWSPAGPPDIGFDFMAPLRADSQVAAQLGSYERADSVADFVVYRRLEAGGGR